MSGNLKKALISPVIQSNESISGFLHRVSKMNYHRYSYLNNFLELSVYQAQNNEINLKALEKINTFILGENDSITEKNGYNLEDFFGSELASKIILKNKVKYCPQCIKERYYHRTIWCITPIHLCTNHNVMLIDLCPQCNRSINLGTFTNQICEICSFNFEDTKCPDPIDNNIIIQSQQQLVNNLWEKESCFIQNCNFAQYFRLAYLSFHLLIGAVDFTGMTFEKLTIFYNQFKGKKSGFNLAVALANVYWMYLDFPKHFYIVLDNFLSRNKGSQRYERLKAFEDIFNVQDFAWVQDAYNSYFIEQIDKGNVRKDFSVFKRKPSLLADRRKIRREEVRQSTGIAFDKLHELNDYNELKIETKYINGQHRYLVEKTPLDGYLKNRNCLISKKEVGLIIGVTSDSVQKIINAGYITPIRVAYSSKVLFQIQEVNNLIQDCLGECLEGISPSMISFHSVLAKYSKYAFTILEIISFTYSSHLNPCRITGKNSYSLADNYYDEGEVKTCMEILKKRRQDEKGLYFSDVMKLLKIGEKRLWRLLEEQGIKADYILVMKDGRKRYYFKEETVSRINKYVELSEGLS
ncbi:TniQ family protein [Paenibacillus sp. GbtcB18]|uniref:TniQ family protein n=1 Tax=Paenibacillus sp. GbtcB18 TaxID=2824763 RepID=UPI001C30077E|nr:TniQ family protein [Paenibacillus sp. GbtcB18]